MLQPIHFQNGASFDQFFSSSKEQRLSDTCPWMFLIFKDPEATLSTWRPVSLFELPIQNPTKMTFSISPIFTSMPLYFGFLETKSLINFFAPGWSFGHYSFSFIILAKLVRSLSLKKSNISPKESSNPSIAIIIRVILIYSISIYSYLTALLTGAYAASVWSRWFGKICNLIVLSRDAASHK